MSRDATAMLALGAIGLVALVALALGLAGGSTTSEGSLFQPADPEAGAAVSGLFAEEGWTLLGIRLRSATYRVQVRFTVPPDCLDRLVDGASWPLDDAACRSEVAIDGVVAGTGRTATGATIVNIERKITRECYEALRSLRAAPWPVSVAVCDR